MHLFTAFVLNHILRSTESQQHPKGQGQESASLDTQQYSAMQRLSLFLSEEDEDDHISDKSLSLLSADHFPSHSLCICKSHQETGELESGER